MSELGKTLNQLYSGTTPLCLGDRYYSQDLIRDLRYAVHSAGRVMKDLMYDFPCLLSGGVVTQGVGDTLDITAAIGYALYSIEVPDSFTSFPPSKVSVDMVHRVESEAKTNYAISSATLDGGTRNYVKLRVAEADGNTRARAKLSGTYAYEKTDSYTFVIDSVAPTSYDVALASFIGSPGGSFTIVCYPPKNLADQIPVGEIRAFAGVDIPDGFLLMDGSALSRTVFSDLYNKLTKDVGTVGISNGSPAVLTLGSGDLSEGDCIELTTTDTLPTGLTPNTNYYWHSTGTGTGNVSTSRANLLAGTYVNTSSAGSGTHSVRRCPYGISGSASFLLPNAQGVSLTGVGSQDINGRTKTGPALGEAREDRMQAWQLGGTIGATAYYSRITSAGNSEGGFPIANCCLMPTNITFQGGDKATAMDDGTNGTPRTGAYTRPNELGIQYIIKY